MELQSTRKCIASPFRLLSRTNRQDWKSTAMVIQLLWIPIYAATTTLLEAFQLAQIVQPASAMQYINSPD